MQTLCHKSRTLCIIWRDSFVSACAACGCIANKTKIAFAGVLVFINRTLVFGWRQGHAHRRFAKTWCHRFVAIQQAAFEIVIVAHAHQWKTVTRSHLVKQPAAIRKIGYVPNLTASSLASNQSRVIGAILPTIDNAIFAETVRGPADTLSHAGYQLLLGQSGYAPEQEEALVLAFLGRQVDGLVLTGGLHSKIVRNSLRQNSAPVVETWDLPAKPLDMVAGFSNFAAGRAVGAYLLETG